MTTTASAPALDLEGRIRRLEDRVAISELVIRYAASIDTADWDGLASCFTEQVHVDFSEAGVPAGDLSSARFAEFARGGLAGFTARQHLSPNHVTTFDETDPDRAVCSSYMYAQHYLAGAEGGDFFLMRGSYTNHVLRTPAGWRIERVVQHLNWLEGNTDAPAQAAARLQAQA